jgi:hypothetical protein
VKKEFSNPRGVPLGSRTPEIASRRALRGRSKRAASARAKRECRWRSEVERKAFRLDMNVAGQPAQAQLRQPGPEQTSATRMRPKMMSHRDMAFFFLTQARSAKTGAKPEEAPPFSSASHLPEPLQPVFGGYGWVQSLIDRALGAFSAQGEAACPRCRKSHVRPGTNPPGRSRGQTGPRGIVMNPDCAPTRTRKAVATAAREGAGRGGA